MKKLSIAIDMGAKNNGVFIVETDGEVILNKKACCVVVDGKLINFSKKDRRENRHKDRNYKRRNQAKRFLKEVIDFNKLDEKQTENIMGLLNNRGYTFLSSSSEFEELQNETLEFSEVYLKEIQKHKSKYDFESFFTNEFEDEKKLVIFLNNQIDKIQKIVDELDIYMKKNDILKNIEALEINSSIKKIDSYTKGIIDKYDIKFEYKDENNNIKEKKLSSLKTEEILKKIIDYKIDLASINFIAEKKIIFEIENKFSNYYCMIKESLEQNNKKLKKREIEHNFKQITNSVFLDLVGKGQKDYNGLKGFLEGIKKEIQTGSKPRKKYIKEIKEEIDKLDFIDDKDSFTNLIANISNLQLRVLRKFFNFNSQKNDRYEILKKYFISHHYKKDSEKQTKKDLFIHLEKNKTLIDFLQNTPPHLSIPPYEDMNNRNTYKCNSMLIRPEFITDDMKLAIDKILENEYFSWLLATENYGVFEKENEQRVKPATNNQYLKKDFTYSKYLQRILDATEERTTKELNPRNVFKHKKMLQRGKISCVKEFKKVFGEDIYITLENIASRFYSEEMKINNGIYEKTTSIFDKCNTNTSYKENVKHTLLKPVYSYKFTPKQAESFIIEIESKRGLKTALELISNEAKKYQNSFYNTILACYENQKCSNDKELIKIVNKLDENIKSIKEIFTKIDVKDSFIDGIEKVNKENITKVINVLKQTYEILFKELKGFSKTCKHCTKENAIRSDEKLVIAKRLLSDVAKPIDGMLDMMLDRLAYEISELIDANDIKDIDELEILLEQNRFEFEDGLNLIKKKNKLNDKDLIKREKHQKLNINICPYTGKSFVKGDYDHILPQSKGVYNSKANMIYCSTDGNAKKGATIYKLENLEKPHLKVVFQTDDTDEIKEFITKNIKLIDSNNFSNFENLKLNEQIALRYALFMPNGSDEFKKAFELVKLDKIKTITNGTQKRLARKVYEKLVHKYKKEFQSINVDSKTISSELVSSTRKLLSETNESITKQTIQNSHSHCIDAMVVFYLANSKIKKNEPLDAKYIFDDVYLAESNINNISKNKKFISSDKKNLDSYKLFDETIYSEHYQHIDINTKGLDILMKHHLVYQNSKNKKIYISNQKDINLNNICQIDVFLTSNLLYKLFLEKDKNTLESLKFLDNIRYSTSRKEIRTIFFNDKKTKLKEFYEIKNIPPYSDKLYKAVYKKLQKNPIIFDINDDNESILNIKKLDEILEEIFDSKQEHKQIRKRGQKRHKFTLPFTGSPKFRIKRKDIWQVLGNKDIATKNYIINGEIKPIPFFTKNTIPLKIADLIDCLLVDKNTESVYEVDINVDEISEYISELKYLVTEASRHTVVVKLRKNTFNNIDFNEIKQYDGAKDEIFKTLIENYIDNQDLELYKYIGSIRDGLNAKAILVDDSKDFITLKYKARLNANKKKIILENLDETYHSK